MKKFLIVLLILSLGGCMSVKAEPQSIKNDYEIEYRDLLERMALLEEELGNLKRDIEEGLYDGICD